MTWSEFLLMGGYGPYVWGSYALTLAAMGGEVFLLLRRRRMPREAIDSTASSHDGRARP